MLSVGIGSQEIGEFVLKTKCVSRISGVRLSVCDLGESFELF